MKNSTRFLRFAFAPAVVWSLVAAGATHAQETNASPDTASSSVVATDSTETENPVVSTTSSTTEPTNDSETVVDSAVGEADDAASEVEVPLEEPAPSIETPIKANPNAGQLFAEIVRYDGAIIIAENKSDKPVTFQTPDTRIEAKRLRLDKANRTLQAEGDVYVERQRRVERAPLVASVIRKRGSFPGEEETITETLRGQNLNYDFKTQKGSLDKAKLSLSGFAVSTDELLVNGRVYTARNVLLRPGSLTEADVLKYGTPPFNIRAKTITVESTDTPLSATDASDSATTSSNPVTGTTSRARVAVKGGALYFKNTRLLPVPSYLFNTLNRGPREQQAFSLTPRLSFSSADRVLVTTQLRYPLTQDAAGTALRADIGLSARIGLRGGVGVEAPTRFGALALDLRKSDIVTTQLTNRIELDRLPELTFRSSFLPLLRLAGNRVAGFRFSAGSGRFRERTIGEDNGVVSATRSQAQINFTTRGNGIAGPYLDVFARVASYGNLSKSYRNTGFEIGYAGQFIPRVVGALSYRSTSLSGETPFRFDRVEISRELRGTVDIEVTPRYIVPLDLRYDLDSKTFRDRSIGILRNYKTFAYGVVYQSARKELRAEFRQGF